jgi:hypothetical protein
MQSFMLCHAADALNCKKRKIYNPVSAVNNQSEQQKPGLKIRCHCGFFSAFRRTMSAVTLPRAAVSDPLVEGA